MPLCAHSDMRTGDTGSFKGTDAPVQRPTSQPIKARVPFLPPGDQQQFLDCFDAAKSQVEQHRWSLEGFARKKLVPFYTTDRPELAHCHEWRPLLLPGKKHVHVQNCEQQEADR